MEPVRPSIHHQRRWFYVLWCALLLLSAGALAAWRVPASRGEARLRLQVRLLEAPAGVRVEAWMGRLEDWGPGVGGWQGGAAESEGLIRLRDQVVCIARRRWLKGLHPDTTDWMVLRFTAPGGEVRYGFYDLGPDLRQGVLAERRVLNLEVPLRWAALSAAVGTPTRIL